MGRYMLLFLVTGRLPWQPAGIKFTQCVSGQNQHFRPCTKNYALDRKMIDTFWIVTSSLSARNFGGDRTTRAGCSSGNWCFLYVTLGLPARGGHISNKYCVTVYGSIFMWFSALFANGLFFRTNYIVLIFVASWRHKFHEIAVQNCEKS